MMLYAIIATTLFIATVLLLIGAAESEKELNNRLTNLNSQYDALAKECKTSEAEVVRLNNELTMAHCHYQNIQALQRKHFEQTVVGYRDSAEVYLVALNDGNPVQVNWNPVETGDGD